MPGSVESVGAMRLSAYLFNSDSGMDGEASVMSVAG